MTKQEKALLDELKTFFNKKYGEEWEEKFKSYTKKLVRDGHLDQEVVDDFLEDIEPDEIVKRFNKFMKEGPSRTYSSSDGCGSSSRSYSSGCGSSSRSYSSGCGSSSRSYSSGCGSSSRSYSSGCGSSQRSSC